MRAAYRNRTDDLRITRSPAHRSRRAICTDGSTRAPRMLPAHRMPRTPGPRPGPRRRPACGNRVLLDVLEAGAAVAGLARGRLRACGMWGGERVSPPHAGVDR